MRKHSVRSRTPNHICYYIYITTDFDHSIIWYDTRLVLQPSGSRHNLMSSIGHLNPQIRTLFNISEICNNPFRDRSPLLRTPVDLCIVAQDAYHEFPTEYVHTLVKIASHGAAVLAVRRGPYPIESIYFSLQYVYCTYMYECVCLRERLYTYV